MQACPIAQHEPSLISSNLCRGFGNSRTIHCRKMIRQINQALQNHKFRDEDKINFIILSNEYMYTL